MKRKYKHISSYNKEPISFRVNSSELDALTKLKIELKNNNLKTSNTFILREALKFICYFPEIYLFFVSRFEEAGNFNWNKKNRSYFLKPVLIRIKEIDDTMTKQEKKLYSLSTEKTLISDY